MDTQTLQYFIAACEGDTITRIAENMHISRQAVSQAIQRLEMEFDCQLFFRTKAGLEMTAAGVMLYQHAKVVEFHLKSARQEMARMKERPQRTLTVGYGRQIINLLPVDHLGTFRQAAPDVVVRPVVDRPEILFEELRQKCLDLVITNTTAKPSHTQSLLIKESPLMIYAAKRDFPEWPSLSCLTPDQLAGCTVFLLPSGMLFAQTVRSFLESEDARCGYQFTQTDEPHSAIKEMLETRRGVYPSSIATRHIQDDFPELFFVELRGVKSAPPSRNIRAVIREDQELTGDISAFVGFLRRIYA